jgi:outer membrane cobalamin receptor
MGRHGVRVDPEARRPALSHILPIPRVVRGADGTEVKYGTPAFSFLRGFFMPEPHSAPSPTTRFTALFVLIATVMGLSWSGTAEEFASVVTGMVVGEDGVPVAGAVVILAPAALSDTTDGAGTFRFIGISAGSYVISASTPELGLRDAVDRIVVPLSGGRPLVLVMRGRTYEADEVIAVSPPPEHEDAVRDRVGMVTVMERSAFEGKARTVAEVLEGSPGATVRSTGGVGDYAELSLRGGNARQVQVYLDGMLLNEAEGGAVNLATVPLANVRSIEVWRSGAPARFGGGAAGGTVNIETWDDLSGDRVVGFGYGSFGAMDARALWQSRKGPSRFLLSAGYESSANDFRFRSDNGTAYNPDDDYWTRRTNDRFSSLTFLGKYRAVLGETAMLDLSDIVLSNAKSLPGKDIVQNSRATLDTGRNLFQAKLSLSRFLLTGVEAEPEFHTITTRERYRDLTGSVGWGTQDNLYRTTAYRFLFPVTVRAGERATFTLTPAADRETYRPEYKLQPTIPLSCDRNHLSLVLDSSARFLADRLLLTANLGCERYFSSFSGQSSPLNRVPPKPVTNLLTNPQAGFRLSIFPGFEVTGSWGDVTRVPGMYELFGDRGTTVSNPELKPERVIRRDLGIRAGSSFGSGRMMFECARFSNRCRNLIQWYANDAGFLFADNVSSSAVDGCEFVWTAVLYRFSLSGNATVQDARVTGERNRIYRGKKLPDSPGRSGSVQAEFESGRIIPFWRTEFKGPYYLDRANQPFNRYPGRVIHDTGFALKFPHRRTTVSFEVRNIGDVHTFDTRGMPLPGRSCFVSLLWELGK